MEGFSRKMRKAVRHGPRSSKLCQMLSSGFRQFTGLWYEIGDDAAREKTSQALRQRAPEMRKILFDTEREEARAATEQQLRQRTMMGMFPPNVPGTLMPMASIAPGTVHPGMMAYAPGPMAPMMFVNPAMFMQPTQQQAQGSKSNPSGAPNAVQPAMQPMMMMDQYQQAAMFQFMANPMMMNPFMQFQHPDQLSPQLTSAPQQANPSIGLGVPLSQLDNRDSGETAEINNAESQCMQEDKRNSSCSSDSNSFPDQAVVPNSSNAEDSEPDDISGEDHAVTAAI
jgi:hypothetical protein